MTTSAATRPGRYDLVDTSAPNGSELAGLRHIVRLILRRDRALLAVWVLVMSALPNALVSATAATYPTEADRVMFAAASAANPAQLGLRGPVFSPTVGGLTAWTIGSSGVLLMGLISLLLVIRHTRVEEQAGRLELIGSTAVGRQAPVAAAVLVVAAGNGAVAVLTALGLTAQGMPVAGSLILGLVLGAGGVIFALIGALVAQLADSPGIARGLALGTLGVFFVIAAVGDLTRTWLVWASPFGWARHAAAFGADRWWVFGLFAALAVATAAGTYLFALNRDLGGGLLQSRPGPATAAASLRSPLALSWRRHRGALASWAIGLTALGALLGAAAGSLDTQLDTPAFRQLSAELGGASPGDVFFRLVLYVLAQVAAAFAIATTLRMRTDEVDHMAEPLLAAPVARLRWAAGHLGIAAAGTAVVLAGLGLGAGLTYGAGLGDAGGQAIRLMATTLTYLPACLVLAGLATALFGWAPRLAVPVTWAALAIVVLADLLGEFRLVTGALLDLSPFQFTARSLTTGTQTATALAVLSLLAIILGAVGLLGFRRRDLA